MKILLSDVKSEGPASAEEDDKMTYSVDVSQPLTPTITVLAQQAQGQSDHNSQMNVMYGLSNMSFYSPKPRWLWPLLNVQEQKPALSLIWHCCSEESSNHMVAGRWHLITSIMAGRVLCSTLTGYEFTFPACSASAKNTNHMLTECVIHNPGISRTKIPHRKWSAAMGYCCSTFPVTLKHLTW